jgi:hypothetical protein
MDLHGTLRGHDKNSCEITGYYSIYNMGYHSHLKNHFRCTNQTDDEKTSGASSIGEYEGEYKRSLKLILINRLKYSVLELVIVCIVAIILLILIRLWS